MFFICWWPKSWSTQLIWVLRWGGVPWKWTREEESPPLDWFVWPHQNSYDEAQNDWLSGLQAWTDISCWVFINQHCPVILHMTSPNPFSAQSLFVFRIVPYLSSGAGLYNWTCWTSWGSHVPNSQGNFQDHKFPLDDIYSLQNSDCTTYLGVVFCNPQTYLHKPKWSLCRKDTLKEILLAFHFQKLFGL